MDGNEQPVLAPERQAEINQVVAAAQQAASAFRELDQAAVDRIVLAMVKAGIRAAADLALLALEETGFGVVEDKMVKNFVATEFLWDYLKDKKSVGVIEEDVDRGIVYVADPIGVVLAITPITNPTSTVLFKAIVAAKTRNAIVFRPSPYAIRCAERAAEVLRAAGEKVGLPPGRSRSSRTPRGRSLITSSGTQASTSSGRPAVRRSSGWPTRRASPASASAPETRRSTCTAPPTSAARSSTFSSPRRSTPR